MTENKYSEQEIFEAKRRVRQIKLFYQSILTYFLVNLMLFIINIQTNPNNLWFLWVLVFWGIGIVYQWFLIFVYDYHFGKEWEEKTLNQVLQQRDK